MIIGVLALIPASSAENRKILIDLSHNERIIQRSVRSCQQQQNTLDKGLALMENGEELIHAGDFSSVIPLLKQSKRYLDQSIDCKKSQECATLIQEYRTKMESRGEEQPGELPESQKETETPSERETLGQSELIVAGTGIALTLIIGFAVLKKRKKPGEVFDPESEKSKLDEMLVKGLISEKEYRIAKEEIKIQKRKMEEEENGIT